MCFIFYFYILYYLSFILTFVAWDGTGLASVINVFWGEASTGVASSRMDDHSDLLVTNPLHIMIHNTRVLHHTLLHSKNWLKITFRQMTSQLSKTKIKKKRNIYIYYRYINFRFKYIIWVPLNIIYYFLTLKKNVYTFYISMYK